VQGEGIWGADYPRALRSAKIALGLLSKWIPETTTTRTFEIPATGTFMLAERNDDHAALFEEGKEAEFFASDEELGDKIRFYLANDAARGRIAAAGRARCERSGYSDAHQLRRVLARVGELVGEPLLAGAHA
jgi:spore maturation protein CgeB